MVSRLLIERHIFFMNGLTPQPLETSTVLKGLFDA
jgi:hypothetical protein